MIYKLKMNYKEKVYYGKMEINIDGNKASGKLECNNLSTEFNDRYNKWK